MVNNEQLINKRLISQCDQNPLGTEAQQKNNNCWLGSRPLLIVEHMINFLSLRNHYWNKKEPERDETKSTAIYVKARIYFVINTKNSYLLELKLKTWNHKL